MTRVPDVLLDLPLLPSGGWIAELGLEQEVADHRREARVDLAFLSQGNRVKESRDDEADEELVVPGGDFTPEADGVLGFGSPNEV